MAALTLATDEDVATVAQGDWPLIAPPSEALALGSDGLFLSTDLWTLTSASNAFAAQGVSPGNVALVQVSSRIQRPFAINAVAANGLTLRRLGLAPQEGVPPSPVGGAVGQSFAVYTVAPQLALVSYELQRRYNLQTADDLQDPQELRLAAVYACLVMVYNDAARNVEQRADDFAGKARLYKAALNNLYATLDVTYGLGAVGSGAMSAPMTPSADAPILPWPCY